MGPCSPCSAIECRGATPLTAPSDSCSGATPVRNSSAGGADAERGGDHGAGARIRRPRPEQSVAPWSTPVLPARDLLRRNRTGQTGHGRPQSASRVPSAWPRQARRGTRRRLRCVGGAGWSCATGWEHPVRALPAFLGALAARAVTAFCPWGVRALRGQRGRRLPIEANHSDAGPGGPGSVDRRARSGDNGINLWLGPAGAFPLLTWTDRAVAHLHDTPRRDERRLGTPPTGRHRGLLRTP